MNGYHTVRSLLELADRVAALESANVAQQTEIDALKAKTASMSTVSVDGHPTVRFSNVNVQVVDGSNDTHGPVNGRGNLIVGYNNNSSDSRTGSHNLIVGDLHSYTSYGGVVFGNNNTSNNLYASVTGGADNTASGIAASVAGGAKNTASASHSSVTGGADNTASGQGASVSGGEDSFATGSRSSVTGGRLNVANGDYETVVGGDAILGCLDDTPTDEAKVCGEGDFDPAD